MLNKLIEEWRIPGMTADIMHCADQLEEVSKGKVLVDQSDLEHFHSLFYKMKQMHQSFEVEEGVTGRYLGIYPLSKEKP